MKRVRIILATIASLSLHGALFMWLETGSSQGVKPADVTLNLTLNTEIYQTPENTQSIEEIEATSEPEPEATSPEIAEITEQLLRPETAALAQQTEPPETTELPKEPLPASVTIPTARELVMSLSDNEETGSFQAFVQPECSAAQEASLAWICDPNGDLAMQRSFTLAETNLFEAAFKRLSATYRDFDRDMNTVATLVDTRAHLTPLDASDPLQVALVAEQRRELRNEILRLDRKYTEVNLLRLIPISRKIFKGLQEVGTKK